MSTGMTETDHPILGPVARYYGSRVQEFGPTARGVDWNSEESQALRFEQLLKLFPSDERMTINDYGCGYGALAAFLADRATITQYRGFDISAEMLAAARVGPIAPFPVEFVSDRRHLAPADYTLASGIFNVRLSTPLEAWARYVLDVLADIDSLSVRGFACNFLTSYSDPERMRQDLYYADPLAIFDHCKRRYSPRVALLHDYGLYEFSIVVKK
jgi:SAM-dependent methyltransferase